MDDRIKVAIRVRPLNDRELNGAQTNAWTVQNDSIFQTQSSDPNKPSSSAVYTFDKIFWGDVSTKDVHEKLAKEIILSTMNGVNGTIFAYGQTSSGKTHTMQGNTKEPGIITLALEDIFQFIMQTPDREFLLRVSYLEIYNENIRDLLNTDNDNLKIHEKNNREIFVGNLTESIVVSPKEVAQLMQRGESNRHVGETNMNERSSRSHTIFRMSRAEGYQEDLLPRVRQGVVLGVYEYRSKIGLNHNLVRILNSFLFMHEKNLVDLAGSERVSLTGAEGIRLREGGHINKSLLTLGTVIAKLSDGGSDRGHIPYRDSKLTRILQPSLGGNARTAIIGTITPASGHCEETTSTLKFASRAKNIQNKPEVNEEISQGDRRPQEAAGRGNALYLILYILNEWSAGVILVIYFEAMQAKNRATSKPSSDLEDHTSQAEGHNDRFVKLMQENEREQARLRSHYEDLKATILTSSHMNTTKSDKKSRKMRRQTWFPGVHNTFDEKSGDNSSDGDNEFLDDFKTESSSNSLNSKKRAVLSPDTGIKKVKLEELEEKIQQVAHSRAAILEGIQKLLDDDGMEMVQDVPGELQGLRSYLVDWRVRLQNARYALQESEKRFADEQRLSLAEVNSLRESYEEAKSKTEEMSKEIEALDATYKAQFNCEAEAVQKAREELVAMEQTMQESRAVKEAEMQSLAEKLRDSEGQRRTLTEEKNELQQKLEQLQQQLENLEKVKRDWETALDERNAAFGSLTNELSEVKEDTDRQVRERDERLETLRVLLEEKEGTIRDLRQDMLIAHASVEELDQKLDASKQLENFLHAEQQKLRDELSEADLVKQTLQGLKQVLNDRETENARLLMQLSEGHDRIQSLIHELSAKEGLVQEMSVERDQLKERMVPALEGKLADAEAIVVNLQSRCVDADERCQAFSCEASDLKVQLAESQYVRENLEEAVRMLNGEHEDLSAKLVDTQNQLRLLSDDTNDRDHKIGDLSRQLTYLQDDLRSKEILITTLQELIRAANALVEDTKQAANERIDEMEAMIEAKIMETETAEEHLQNLQSKYHDSETELERLRRQLAENEDETDVLRKQVQQRQSMLTENEVAYAEQFATVTNSHQRHVQEMEAVTEDLRRKLEDAEERARLLSQEVAEVQGRVTIFEQSENDLRLTIASLEHKVSEADGLFQSTRVDANRMIGELEVALKTAEDSNIAHEKQYLEATSELERLNQYLANANRELQVLRDAGQRNDASRAEKEMVYSKQLSSLQAEYTQIVQEKDACDEQVRSLVEEVDGLRHQLEDYEKIKDEYGILTIQLQEFPKCIQSLETTLETTVEAKAVMEKRLTQKIQELESENDVVVERLKRDSQNVLKDWQHQMEEMELQLSDAKKEIELKTSQEQEIRTRIERGDYVDAGKLESLRIDMETKWNNERLALQNEIDTGCRELRTMETRLDNVKQELASAIKYGQDVDFKIQSGEYTSREEVLKMEQQLKTSFLEERSQLQSKLQDLDCELQTVHALLEEARKDVQIKQSQLLEVAHRFQSGELVGVDKLKQLEANLSERWNAERTELEHAFEISKKNLQTTENHLQVAQEELGVMMEKEKEMVAKIERGDYLDIAKVIQMRSEMEQKWQEERGALMGNLESAAVDLASVTTMLDQTQAEIDLMSRRDEEVAARIAAGDLVERTKFEQDRAEIIMEWEREKTTFKIDIESLKKQLEVAQASIEHLKREMELKDRQTQEITTRLQRGGELTVQELTRLNTEEKTKRTELESVVSELYSKMNAQHVELEAAKRELRQKALAFDKLGAEYEKQRAFFSKEQKASSQKIQELETRSNDISRSSVDSNRKITQLRQQLHQRESEVQELHKRIEQHESKISKDNHANLIQSQIAENAETQSNELMMLTSLRAEVAKLSVEKENLGKQINTQRMIAENEITKYKHLEAAYEKLATDSLKLKKENERLLEENVVAGERDSEAGEPVPKRKHERTRDKERMKGTISEQSKDGKENSQHGNLGSEKAINPIDPADTRAPLIDTNVSNASTRRQRLANRQNRSEGGATGEKEAAECNQQ
ncbi:hypothetical protein BC938DRAFT_480720 [Jimgerdemannia flammicorona]|uniref:Kinesin motor domain-containing protein n=1 Tax=Jimgerdemannia flammicorona TaxID=994334 RepID=A0A433QHR8_9FUNG|nr:hypothetical protein BC938DRAFT_480720 [Jimgerdemannia flammicorona]